MKIWMMQADANHYNYFLVADKNDIDQLIEPTAFNGSPMKHRWVPLKVRVLKEVREGDMQPLFGDLPVINEKSLSVLHELIKDDVEVLPLSYNKGAYCALNVLAIQDCIDYDKSIVERFDDGTIMRFEKYVFDKNKLAPKHIFKIKDEVRRSSFVSDVFRNRVIEQGLTGFLFTEIPLSHS